MTIRDEVYRKCRKYWISPFETKDQNLRISNVENYFIGNFKNWINSEMNIEYNDNKLWYMYMYTNTWILHQYGLTVTGWGSNEDIMVSVWYVEKFKQIYSSGLLYMTLIFREYVIDINLFNVNWEKRIWSVVANKITFMYLSIH